VNSSNSEVDPSYLRVSPFDSNSDVDSDYIPLNEGLFVRTIVALKGEKKSTGDSNKELDWTPFGGALCSDHFYVPKEEEERRWEEEEAKHCLFRDFNRALNLIYLKIKRV
ncbi:hypothetical protein TorRG33x02_052940, partial [Trema orientale]